MRIKRIATIETLKRYEPALRKLVPQYLRASHSRFTVSGLLRLILHNCHNPLFNCCVVENDKGPVGFAIASVVTTDYGRRVMVDHFHTPNLKLSVKVYDLLTERLCRDFSIPKSEVYMVTYRNPEAWLRYIKSRKRSAEIYGWVLRRTDEEDYDV